MNSINGTKNGTKKQYFSAAKNVKCLSAFVANF